MPYFRKLDESWLGIELELFNRIGALHRISEKLSKMDINIEYLETTEVSREIYKLFMVLSSSQPIDYNVLKKELVTEKEFVKDVIEASEFNKIIFSSKHYLKDLGGIRAILLEEGAMDGFIRGIKGALGAEAGSHLLYHIGFGVGRSLYENFLKHMSRGDMSRLLVGIRALYHGLGWGMVASDRLTGEDELTITLLDNWECSLYDGMSTEPEGSFTRGILSGILSIHSGKKVVAVENSCIARGDPFCIFRLSILK